MLEEKITMVGEREIKKETKHFRINHSCVDILLPLMLNNIENASKLNEENFYLLDCLIKCKLLLSNIEISENYSKNVQNLLNYCKEEHSDIPLDSYTYVYLTNNNVDTLINWLKEKVTNDKDLNSVEEKVLNDLVQFKSSFYEDPDTDTSFIDFMKEIEKLQILLNNSASQ